jgi:CRP-like cAMP-binding protein
MPFYKEMVDMLTDDKSGDDFIVKFFKGA